MYDVAIVGGGSAGLSAALVLGRARRRTVLLDTGAPRNAPARAAHGVFTRDQTPPLELLRTAREQLIPYDSIRLRPGRAISLVPVGQGFQVSLEDGSALEARKVLLAHGVRDDLPDIDGVRDLWGASVLHCPYCHGWEVRDQPLAVYGRGQSALDLITLVSGWSADLVLCSDGHADLDESERARLGRHGVPIREERVVRLDRTGRTLERIVFADGSALARRAMFLRPALRLSTDLSSQVGCQLTDGGLIETDELGETTVPGVYAAGDIASGAHSVLRAAAGGATAAMGINRALAAESFA